MLWKNYKRTVNKFKRSSPDSKKRKLNLRPKSKLLRKLLASLKLGELSTLRNL
jgi:hypothetical protein